MAISLITGKSLLDYKAPQPQRYYLQPNYGLPAVSSSSTTKNTGSSGTGGSKGSNTKTSSKSSNNKKSSDKKKQKSMEDYLKEAAKKARAAMETKYNAAKARGEQQLADLGEMSKLTEGDITNAIEGYRGQVANQGKKVWGAVEEGVNKARNVAQDVQRANRNTMRGLGILGSTYAGEKLQAPLSEFSEQRANLYKQGQQQINDLDTMLTTKVGELTSQLNQTKLKFQQMANDIKSDIRFSAAERDEALAQLEQSLTDKIATARSNANALAQQVAQMKMNISTSIAAAMQQANPTADISGILSQGLDVANDLFDRSGMTAAMYGYQDPEDKDKQLAWL